MNVEAPIRAPRGIKDILPPDAARFETVLKEAEAILALGGFQKVLLPMFESTSLFARSIGGATDIVEKEMYTFLDKGGDQYSLRPEGTASLLRAAIEHRLVDPSRVIRLAYSGPMFRHERPQAGRLRQFTQIGAEVLGPLTPSDDVDLLSLLHRMAIDFALPSWSLLLNSLGCPLCRPAYRESLVSFLLAHSGSLCETCHRRTAQNPLRVLDCKVPSCQETLERAPRITEHLCPKSRDHFEEVKRGLDALDIPYVLSHRLVRGLDYYTETTFEFVSDALGAQSTWAAGGRYDGLTAELGGPDVPGIGFAAGIERLWLLREKAGTLPAPERHPVRILVFSMDAKGNGAALDLVRKLRKEGIPASGHFSGGKIKSAFRQAERDGALFLAILGEDELRQETVQIKNLSTGEQKAWPLNDAKTIADRIRTEGTSSIPLSTRQET
ncbi:histidine--tRNA ligase [Leptospirillum ferriphilum]|uniref:histidine--tRNA ligase n=1 Tax=Leptospirillum ferriphilum TaxID=178606 RepID=UPI0009855F88|nr:histidine--tRNA ligase [Leptospirillum ferriphilum]OOH76438.1 histidine--tRNA ligase [Leptospirillum ferriphilum]